MRTALARLWRPFLRHSLQGTSEPINDAAAQRNNRQEKAGHSATLRVAGGPIGLGLLCTMQRQICIFFGQRMN
jgi:hypothetical protein